MPEPRNQAHKVFRSAFSRRNLNKVYEEKISTSFASGLDGTSQQIFKSNLNDEIDLISRKVKNGNYRFTTYKPKLISKGAHRLPRALSIPTIRDRLVLRALNTVLAGVFGDAQIKRPHVYIKKISDVLSVAEQDRSFVRMDIQDFYPSVNHDILLRILKKRIRKPEILRLVSKAISTPTAGAVLGDRGIPQGLSISNILSSIYLQELDVKFSQKYNFFRYVDDILIVCKSDIADIVFQEIKTDLGLLHLRCHELGIGSKSKIVNVDQGIDYLGFQIAPNSVSVRESSFKRMIENILSVLTGYKHLPETKKSETQLIWRLNLKITGCIFTGKRYGWLFFFSQTSDIHQLARLDKFIDAQLKQRNLFQLRPAIKKFVRTYHEIRFNLDQSKYIPKFDEYDVEQMIQTLSHAQGMPEEYYRDNLTPQEITDEFKRQIGRQTKELHQDLIEAFS